MHHFHRQKHPQHWPELYYSWLNNGATSFFVNLFYDLCGVKASTYSEFLSTKTLQSRKRQLSLTHNDWGRSWDAFELFPQLLEDVVEVGEGDGAADVEQNGVLLSVDPLKVLQLSKDSGFVDFTQLFDLVSTL
jgi:hypothetical protein